MAFIAKSLLGPKADEEECLRTEQEKALFVQVAQQARLIDDTAAHVKNLTKLMGRSNAAHQSYLSQSRRVTAEMAAYSALLKEHAPSTPASGPTSPSMPEPEEVLSEGTGEDRETKKRGGRKKARKHVHVVCSKVLGRVFSLSLFLFSFFFFFINLFFFPIFLATTIGKPPLIGTKP